jgi:hypothetical protein
MSTTDTPTALAASPNAFVELPGSVGERWTCFFAPFAPYPQAPREVVLLSYGRTTAESGLERLRYGGSRYCAFSLERTRVLAGAWPSAEPLSAPAYLLRPGRFVAVVPSINRRWAPAVPAVAPVGRIAGSGATEQEACAAVLALGMRAFVGRIEYIIQCETGGDIGGIEKGPAGLVFGW